MGTQCNALICHRGHDLAHGGQRAGGKAATVQCALRRGVLGGLVIGDVMDCGQAGQAAQGTTPPMPGTTAIPGPRPGYIPRRVDETSTKLARQSLGDGPSCVANRTISAPSPGG
jgi:hypothetical protein